MKTKFNFFILSLILSLLILGSCQEEVIEIINPQNDTTISTDSPLVGLVEQTTQLDGSFDNILDNSSCTTVVLPVTVFANGQEVVINTEDDYFLVERIFDENDSIENVLEIVYPITILKFQKYLQDLSLTRKSLPCLELQMVILCQFSLLRFFFPARDKHT